MPRFLWLALLTAMVAACTPSVSQPLAGEAKFTALGLNDRQVTEIGREEAQAWLQDLPARSAAALVLDGGDEGTTGPLEVVHDLDNHEVQVTATDLDYQPVGTAIPEGSTLTAVFAYDPTAGHGVAQLRELCVEERCVALPEQIESGEVFGVDPVVVAAALSEFAGAAAAHARYAVRAEGWLTNEQSPLSGDDVRFFLATRQDDGGSVDCMLAFRESASALPRVPLSLCRSAADGAPVNGHTHLRLHPPLETAN